MNKQETQQAVQTELPLIAPVVPAGEEDRVANVYHAVENHIGFVPDGLKLYSFSPPLLEHFAGNIAYFNGGTRLAPSLMAMIRYLVSWQAQCLYCIDLNEAYMMNLGMDIDEVRAARANPELAPIQDNERSLLRLALKSVEAPEAVTEQDLVDVRNQGWNDRDIFDVVVQAANNRAFNMILRTFNLEQQGAFA